VGGPAVETVRHVDDDERRARLGVRHALAAPVADTLAAARAVTCLHATEPASVHLAAWARCGATRDDVDHALYADRSVVKQLAMRRTVFAFPRELLPAVWGSASARVAEQQRRRMAKEMEATGVAQDGEAWTAEHLELVRRMIEQDGPMTTSEVRAALPTLDARITRGKGRYQADVAVAASVIVTLAASGAIVRGENDGGWKISRPRWTSPKAWLGDVPDPLPEPEGYAALVAAWLRSFGPGTEDDLTWWLGSTKGAVRTALAGIEATPVALDDGSTGWVAADDTADLVVAPSIDPWVALLPTLDPTTMGWRERRFYLDPAHTPYLFDSAGNAGTTIWVDGRVVGCWVQDEQECVRLVFLEEVSRDARRRLDAEAARLDEFLGGEHIRNVFASPQVRRERLR
jgi:hypothetical protein